MDDIEYGSSKAEDEVAAVRRLRSTKRDKLPVSDTKVKPASFSPLVAVRGACDACRRRGVKCTVDGTKACPHCADSGSVCTLDGVPQASGTRIPWKSKIRLGEDRYLSVGRPVKIDLHPPLPDATPGLPQSGFRQLNQGMEKQLGALFAVELSNNLKGFDTALKSGFALRELFNIYSSFLITRAKTAFNWSTYYAFDGQREEIAELWILIEEVRRTKGSLPIVRADFDVALKRGAFPSQLIDSALFVLDMNEGNEPVQLDDTVADAKTFLLEGVEFQWLLSRLRLASSTTSACPILESVRYSLMNACSEDEPLQITLNLEWDPRAFLREQYEATSLPSLSDVICIVGESVTAEAMTCLEYISRTWPMIGPETLRLLDMALNNAISDEPGISSKAGNITPEESLKQMKASTRGTEPFEIPLEIDRSLMRLIDSTDIGLDELVSFDRLAQAVEDAEGPSKLWLRRQFKRLTGTKHFGLIRFRRYKHGAEERSELKAIDFSRMEQAEDLQSEGYTAADAAAMATLVEGATSTYDGKLHLTFEIWQSSIRRSFSYQTSVRKPFKLFSDQEIVESDRNLSLEVRFEQGKTLITVRSSHHPYLVEAGEVITWLSAACRSSGYENVMLYCWPAVEVDKSSKIANVRCQVYDIEKHSSLDPRSSRNSESCWRRIFNNATITDGYPILRRIHEEKGLRISLEMMATLACTSRATIYDETLLLKGLCSMFVPVLQTASSIVWHYLLNDDLSWMSHNQARDSCLEVAQIDFSALSKSNHFVGWTRRSESVIGIESAPYNSIGYSGSSFVKAGFALDGITVGFSKVIELSTKIMPGKKDSRILGASGGPYARVIRIAALTNVVFYDVSAKRGWLLDGASALLHLSRAALTSSHAPKLDFGSTAPPAHQFAHLDCLVSGHTCAEDVLLNPRNRNIVLYEDATPWLFQDLVLQNWEVLSEIRSQVLKVQNSETKGWNVPTLASPRLDGFEFTDIISGKSPLRPRSAKLESSSSQWLKLIAESGTVNILGSSFGELLRPSAFGCRNSVEVPSGASFLVAPTQRLRCIADEFGEVKDEYWKLVPGLFWNEPYRSFPSIPCGCVPHDPQGTCGKLITELQTQRLKISKENQKQKQEDVLESCPSGAIIIGLSSALKKIPRGWQGTTTSLPTQRISSNGSDSGVDLGSSLSPSSSRSSY